MTPTYAPTSPALAAAARRQGGDLRGVPDADDQLDLGTCVHLGGPPPAFGAALAAIDPASLRTHPYGMAERFLAAYSQFMRIDPDDDGFLLAGNGITNFLMILHRLYPDGVTVWPGYTETIERFGPADDHGATLDTPERRAQRIEHAMARHRLVVIDNPVNPSGLHIPSAELAHIADRNPGSILIVDEAYADFLSERDSLIGVELDNVAVLVAPNKAFGMASVRTGAMWTRRFELAQAVDAQQHRWPIGKVDGTLAIASLGEVDWLARTRAELLDNAAWMRRRMTAFLDVEPVDSRLHFGFWPLEPTWLDRARRTLERRGVTVRVFDRPNPGRVVGMRVVAPSTPQQMQRLDQATADGP